MGFTFEQLHLLALCIAAVGIVLADYIGWQYLRGSVTTVSAVTLRRLHRVVWLGLGLMIATGGALVAEQPEVLTEVSFYVKLLMVAALLFNGVCIGKLMQVATTTPYRALDQQIRRRLMLSGAVSLTCWIGAAVIGFTGL